MTVSLVIKWAAYLLFLSLYLSNVRSYYRSPRKPTHPIKRAIFPGEEQKTCSEISTSHLDRGTIPNYIFELNSHSKAGYILCFDEELLGLQPDLLRWLDPSVRIMLCDSPLLAHFNINNRLTKDVKAQIRWVDIHFSDDAPWPRHPSIDTYHYQQNTNLITIMYVSHQSPSLLEARKAGLKTMAVSV